MSRHKITDNKIIPYDQRPQQFMGVPVIAREPGMVRHPHPSQSGRLVPTRGVTSVLLENGHEFGECDICGITKESLRSIVAHLTSHNPNKNEPIYEVETLRRVLRIAAEERAAGIRGYAERAAERLNQTDLKTVGGGPWTSQTVSSLWTHYHEKYGPQRVRRVRAVAPTSPAAPTMKPASKSGHPLNALQDVGQKLDELDIANAEMARRLSQLRDLAAALAAHVADPTTVEKARKYDNMMAAIHQSS